MKWRTQTSSRAIHSWQRLGQTWGEGMGTGRGRTHSLRMSIPPPSSPTRTAQQAQRKHARGGANANGDLGAVGGCGGSEGGQGPADQRGSNVGPEDGDHWQGGGGLQGAGQAVQAVAGQRGGSRQLRPQPAQGSGGIQKVRTTTGEGRSMTGRRGREGRGSLSPPWSVAGCGRDDGWGGLLRLRGISLL